LDEIPATMDSSLDVILSVIQEKRISTVFVGIPRAKKHATPKQQRVCSQIELFVSQLEKNLS
jgi:RNase H-fold protein (predicted Holliday junction resolvase)